MSESPNYLGYQAEQAAFREHNAKKRGAERFSDLPSETREQAAAASSEANKKEKVTTVIDWEVQIQSTKALLNQLYNED